MGYKSCVSRIYPPTPWFTDTSDCVGGYSGLVEIPGYWDWWDSGTVGHTIVHTGILHLSGFGTFLLLLFLAAVFYLLAGVFIQKMKGAEGMELIPHLNFWKSLPDRVKTWFTFLKTGGRLGSDSYESI